MPTIDTNKVVEDTLRVVANAIIMGTLHVNMEEELPGANEKMLDCLHFLYKSYDNLAANSDTFVW